MRTQLLTALVLVGVTAIAGVEAQRGQGQGAAPGQGPRQRVRPIQQVRSNFYFIPGSDVNTYPIPGSAYSESARTTSTGSNVGVFITDRGVVLIDTMNPGFAPEILEQVRTVTNKPIIMILNTHAHADHTGGNADFPNVEYVVQANTRANMERLPIFKDEKAAFLPKKTFTDKSTLFEGNDRIDLYYFGRGHTNGDTWIVFPNLRLMHTGDMFQRKDLPLVDVTNNNGNALEFADTLSKASSSIAGVDTVIPGHSPTLMKWNDFLEYVDFYKEFVTTTRMAMSAGKTVDDAATDYRPSERFRNYEFQAARVKQNVQSIYDSSR